MFRSLTPAVVLVFLAGAAHSEDLHYPDARKADQVDTYHGTQVADPYRWLEDPDSAETRRWIEAENKVTFGYLEAIPERARIRQRLTELWNFERYGVPRKEGPRYFFTRNDGLQNQSVLYTMDALHDLPRVLLDPNKLSTDGTTALKELAIREDGKYLAYGLSNAGSDWEQWRVRDVSKASDTDDLLEWVKFSGASWTKDGKGFFYSRYAEPDEAQKLQTLNYFQKLYYHRMGTAQRDDPLIYERPDKKDWMFHGTVSDDGRYLIITIQQGTDTRNRVYYLELEGGPGSGPEATPVASGKQPVALLNDFDADYSFVENEGSLFYFRTDLDAPRGRLIAIDINSPARTNWRTIIPEGKETLRAVNLLNHQFVAEYMQDAHSAVRIHDLNGKFLRNVDLPGIGTASGFGGRKADTETFYTFTSFTTPGVVYRYDLVAGTSSVFREPRLKFDPALFETKQVFYTSKDGTRVPMFIVAKRGLKLDGNNPVLLYGYGGFNIALTPSFSPSTLAWLEMGGVYAQPSLRGGGEYGEDWHKGGMKQNKQNVFDDFIAAAEWLIQNRYTRKEKLAIFGGSNGGLLVGACLTQRPDLFGAALPAVGVMDMLRFHRFTIGWAWVSDYGSAENEADFRTLFRYSPLHNLKQGTRYPATLITTADHDDRVVPAHSFKFAAALQAAQAGNAPTLIRIETRAGHGAGKPTSKQIEESADRLAFLFRNLGMREVGKNQ